MATESLEMTIKSLDDAVKTFALHPTGDYLALINGKGDLLIYRLVSEKGPLGKHYIGSNLVLNQNVLSKLSSRNFEEGYRISWRNTKDVQTTSTSGSSSSSDTLQLCIPQHDGFPMIFTRQSPLVTNEMEGSSSTRNEIWDDNTILTSDAYEQTLSHCRESVNLVSFSPNGKYLASADCTGKILIWDIPTKDAITSYQCHDLAEVPQQLLDLQWGACEGDNYLIVLSQVGVAKIDNVINTSLGHPLPTGSYSEAIAPPEPPTITPSKSSSQVRSMEAVPAPSSRKRIKKSVGFGAEKDEEEDFDFTESITAIKKTVLQPDLPPTAKGTVIQDEDDDDEENAGAVAASISAPMMKTAVTGKAVSAAIGEDDDLSDDLEGVDLVADGMDEFLVDDHRLKQNHQGLSSASLSNLLFHQSPFQSSSTTYDERRRRYLVWNSVGSIITRDEDIGNRIEIKFADTSSGSFHKNEHFNDNYGFELGDLSSHGAIFATLPEEQIESSMTPQGMNLNLDDDDDIMGDGPSGTRKKKLGSILFYKAFYSKIEIGYFANETFTVSFPHREVVRCVTTSLGWCAVVTSLNSLFYLRIFTTAGMQLHISVLKGSVVTLCSSFHLLGVVYNSSGMVSKSSPHLLVDLFHVTPITKSCDNSSSSGTAGTALPNITCLLSQCILPLSSMSSLQWISFSSNSQLVSLDTSGQLLMLFTFSSSPSSSTTSQWIPILDTNHLKKNLIDYHLWPITVKADKLCYVLLSGQKKPSIHPQPVVTAKPFRLPVVDLKGIVQDGGVNGIDRNRDTLWLSLALTHHQHTLEAHLISGYPLPEITPITTATSGGGTAGGTAELCSLDEALSQEVIGMDKILLKLFYEHCKKQRIAMALDVIGRMVTTDALESAIKVANHFSKTSLASILSEILNEKRREKRSLESEFESEIRKEPSHAIVQTSVGSGQRPGIASFKSSSRENRGDEESQFQLAQSSYVSTQSYEYAASQQHQQETEEEDSFLHTPEKGSKSGHHSVLSNKKTLTGPLFSGTTEEERPKTTIPVNK